MLSILSFFSWLTNGPLNRLLSTIDNKVDNETQRASLRTDAIKTYVDAQARVLTGKGWWFPLFFIVPLGLWFSSIMIYNILWCHGCMFPQTWTIAALPAPLDQWSGVIISSLFMGKAGEAIIDKWRK